MRKLIKVAMVATALFIAPSHAMETEPTDADILATDISACTLNQEQNTSEQQTPVDDPIYFTIRNKTCEDMPVNLNIIHSEHNSEMNIHDFVILFDRVKLVKSHSESHFRQSECVFFKWALDSYKAQTPNNCDFMVQMTFNHKIDSFLIQKSKIQSEGIDPYHVPYGRTYTIKPTKYLSHLNELVESFHICYID